MRSESDQHGTRRVISLLRTYPFNKGVITVVKEGKLRLVFLVPAVSVAYCSCSPIPPYLISIDFRAVPSGRMSADFQAIGVGPLRPLIIFLLKTEKTGP